MFLLLYLGPHWEQMCSQNYYELWNLLVFSGGNALENEYLHKQSHTWNIITELGLYYGHAKKNSEPRHMKPYILKCNCINFYNLILELLRGWHIL